MADEEGAEARQLAGNTAAVALALAALGALAVLRLWPSGSTGSGKSGGSSICSGSSRDGGAARETRTGSQRCAVGRARGGGGAAVEAASDLVRNCDAVYVDSGDGAGPRPLRDVVPELSGLQGSGEAVTEDTAQALASALQRGLEGARPAGSGALPRGLAWLVIDALSVTHSMDCLLDAQVLPPAMYQPAYTVVLAGDSVRCLTDGFVGSPVLGPPHPSAKYTATRMRLLTGDLFQAAVEQADAVPVDYCLGPTAARTAAAVRADTRPALRRLAASAASDLAWRELLLA